jgi:mRNA-degrading endonuclease toxin of MazEF toxin-antitoxin module
MNVKRGDVVLVNYPFASIPGSKVRPAVVVQCNRNNTRLGNTIIVQVTSRTKFATTEPTQLLIRAGSVVGRQAGLVRDSAISCENIFTVRSDAIIRKIGTLTYDAMDQVSDCLKVSLELK